MSSSFASPIENNNNNFNNFDDENSPTTTSKWMKEKQERFKNNKKQKEDDKDKIIPPTSSPSSSSPFTATTSNIISDQYPEYFNRHTTSHSNTNQQRQEPVFSSRIPNKVNTNEKDANSKYFQSSSSSSQPLSPFELLQQKQRQRETNYFYLTDDETMLLVAVVIIVVLVYIKSAMMNDFDSYYRGWSSQLREENQQVAHERIAKILDQEATNFMRQMRMSQSKFFERPQDFIEWCQARHPTIQREILARQIATASNRFFSQLQPGQAQYSPLAGARRRMREMDEMRSMAAATNGDPNMNAQFSPRRRHENGFYEANVNAQYHHDLLAQQALYRSDAGIPWYKKVVNYFVSSSANGAALNGNNFARPHPYAHLQGEDREIAAGGAGGGGGMSPFSSPSFRSYDKGPGEERMQRIMTRYEEYKTKKMEEFVKEKEQRTKNQQGNKMMTDEEKQKLQEQDDAREKEIPAQAMKEAYDDAGSPSNVYVAGFAGRHNPAHYHNSHNQSHQNNYENNNGNDNNNNWNWSYPPQNLNSGGNNYGNNNNNQNFYNPQQQPYPQQQYYNQNPSYYNPYNSNQQFWNNNWNNAPNSFTNPNGHNNSFGNNNNSNNNMNRNGFNNNSNNNNSGNSRPVNNNTNNNNSTNSANLPAGRGTATGNTSSNNNNNNNNNNNMTTGTGFVNGNNRVNMNNVSNSNAANASNQQNVTPSRAVFEGGVSPNTNQRNNNNNNNEGGQQQMARAPSRQQIDIEIIKQEAQLGRKMSIKERLEFRTSLGKGE